jgi:hypothetical protein
MQDAASEVQLRDEEGGIRPDFLHAVSAALDAGAAETLRELTLDLHAADLPTFPLRLITRAIIAMLGRG